MHFRSTEQANFASLVEQHLHAPDAPLLLEGATGMGKTRAYLAPLLASGLRVAIVLPTHALIDQLLASTDLSACRGTASVTAFRPARFYNSREACQEARQAAQDAQVMLCTSASVIIDQRLAGAYNGSTQRDYILFDEADQLPSAAALQQDCEIGADVLRLYNIRIDDGIQAAVRALLAKTRIEPEVRAAALLIQEALEEPAWFRTAGLTEDGSIALFHRLPGRLLKRIANRGNVAFVSATLSVNGNFNVFRAAMGIERASSLSAIIEPAHHGQASFHVLEEHPVNSPEWLDKTRALMLDVDRPCLVITPSFDLSEQLRVPGATVRLRDETTAAAVARMTDGLLVAAGAWAGLDTPVQWRSIIVPRIPFPAPTILDEKVESSYINSRNEGGRRLRQAVGRGLRSPDAKLDFYLLDPRHEKVRWFVPSRFADAWKNRMVEGRRREVQLSQIERSSYYRKRALAAYGTFCHACGFTPRVDSQIHVHHLHPLHEGERETTLADLVPLCANCHALAHSESPPLALDALRGLVREPVVRAI